MLVHCREYLLQRGLHPVRFDLNCTAVGCRLVVAGEEPVRIDSIRGDHSAKHVESGIRRESVDAHAQRYFVNAQRGRYCTKVSATLPADQTAKARGDSTPVQMSSFPEGAGSK